MTPLRRHHIVILLVILLAFGLRLYAIDRQDLWGDEAISVWLSSQSLPQAFLGTTGAHPPLYRLLLYLWLRPAGALPLAVRFLSVLFGTLTVPVVYILGRRAFDCTIAGFAALLTAVSPVLVYYSQEARMYTLVTFLAALSVYWTMRILRQGQSATLAYFLTTLAATYSHYYAFFVVFAENLIVIPRLLRGRQWATLRCWLAAQATMALAYIPWLAVKSGFLTSKVGDRFTGWDFSTAINVVERTLAAFGAGLAVSPTEAWVIAALFLLAVVAGLVAVFGKHRTPSWLIVAYLTVPILAAFIVSPIMSLVYPRYLLLIAPGFYLLASRGVTACGHLWRPLGAVGALLLLAGSSYGLHGYYTDEEYIRGRYGEMMAYVQANAQPDDGLILANQLQRPILEYYRPSDVDTYLFPSFEYPLEDPRTARDLEAVAARHPRLWLVRYGNPAEYDPDGYLARWLATHGNKAYFGGWVDADLSLYVMAPAAMDETIQNLLRADLGDQVRLLGYSLSTEHTQMQETLQLAPGDTLLLSLYWQALAPMTERYTVFTHLLDGQAQIQAQMDSEPQGGGLPTDRWTAGQIVQDNYALTVAADAVPGFYVLEVGMYLLETLERLPVRDVESGANLGDRILLGTVEVVNNE